MKSGMDRELAINREFAVNRKEPAFWWALAVSIIVHLFFLSLVSLGRPGGPGGLYLIEGGVIDLAAQTGEMGPERVSSQSKVAAASAKPAENEQPAVKKQPVEKQQPKPQSEVITSTKGAEKLAAKPVKKEEKPKPPVSGQSPEARGEKGQVTKSRQTQKEEENTLPEQPVGKGQGPGTGPGAGTGPAAATGAGTGPGLGSGQGSGAGSGDGSGTGTGGSGVLDGQALIALGKAIVYPKNAQNEGVTGTVVARIFVKADGAAEKVVLEKSSGDVRLDTQVVKTLAGQSFRPAAKNYTLSLKIAFEAGGVVSVSNNE